nr:hypothetical protein [Tanacetum cinerariifolium]
MSIQEMKDLKQQYLDEMKRSINSEYRDEIKIDELNGNFNRMGIEINKKEKLQQLEHVSNLSTYPSKRFNSFCYDDDDDEDYTAVITPDFPITDSLIMKNEHLDTIPETESDEFIKSSVENLVQIPSESEDFSNIESECDILDCDDSQTTNFSTFSNPLFDDSTSSDDEPIHEEVIHEMSFKTYSNPLFDLDEEIISNRLLHDDTIPLPDILDFSNVVRVFLPFFTYPVISSILLSSGSEDTIFDPGISSYHFSSLESGASHRSGTFMKFIVYPNHLNESPMKILSSTCSTMDQ